MKSRLTVKKTHLLCAITLLLTLFSGQSSKLFGISGGAAYQLLYYSKYISALFLVAYALSRPRKVSDYEVKRLLTILLPLVVLMIVVECFAVFTSPVPAMYGIRYWTRSLAVFLDRFCIYAVVIGIWELCGDEAIECITNTFIVDEILIFISAIFHVGVAGIVESFLGAFAFSEGASNYFEVHELTFAIGLCIIYYLFFAERKKHNTGKLVFLVISFILGSKRIGMAGIAAAGLFSLFVHKKGLSRRKLITIGIVGVLVCYGYLFIVYNNEFFAILNEHGINNMGRDLIYAYFVRRTKLSPTQMGWGMAGVAKVVENMDRSEVMYMAAVRGVHNDILKIYINFGFVGSLIWYAFNLIYFPVKFMNEYGKKAATIYMALILYLFITYLTDNTESYFVCQVALLLIPITEYLKEKNRSVYCEN